MTEARHNWHRALFRKSVLKQAKWRAITSMLPAESDSANRLVGGQPTGRRGLDLGGDNGVMSLMLRELGGTWCSADLDEETVASIRDLVGTDVYLTDGKVLPFPDGNFDVVVVIDMFEHVDRDDLLVREIHRVLRQGGRLIAVVPHVKRLSLLRRLRLASGLTDEWHGHVRPGYTKSGIDELFRPCFRIEQKRTYNRAFSELLDIALNYALERKRRPAQSACRSPQTPASKGNVMTHDAFARFEKMFRLYRRVYPFMWAFCRLDRIWPATGYQMVVSATAKESISP